MVDDGLNDKIPSVNISFRYCVRAVGRSGACI
jgi:hypothetical protein